MSAKRLLCASVSAAVLLAGTVPPAPINAQTPTPAIVPSANTPTPDQDLIFQQPTPEQAMRAAAAQYAASKPGGNPDLPLMYLAAWNLWRQNPEATGDELLNRFQEQESLTGGFLSGDAVVDLFQDLGKAGTGVGLASLGPAAPLAIWFVNDVLIDSGAGGYLLDRFSTYHGAPPLPTDDERRAYGQELARTPDLWIGFQATAEVRPESFGRLMTYLDEKHLDLPAGLTTDSMMQRLPLEFRTDQNLNTLITRLQQEAVADDHFREEIQARLGRFEELAGEAKDVINQTNSTISGLAEIAARQSAAQAQAELGNEIRKQFNEVRATSILFANLLRLSGNPELQQAGIALGTAASGFTQIFENAALWQAGLISTVGMASGVVGGMMIVASLMQKPQPDAVQLALRQISDQIRNLTTEMRQSFAVVNEKLDVALDLAYRNYQETLRVGANVEAARQDLSRIRNDIRDLQSRLVLLMEDLVERESQQAAVRCLRYRQDFRSDMSEQDFIDCAQEYFAYATEDSRALAVLGSDVVPDEKLAEELERGLPYSVKLLALFAAGRLGRGDLPPSAISDIVNPVRWAAGVQAYVRLASDWPELYEKTATLAQVQDMERLGRNLLDVFARIAGDSRATRRAFYKGVLDFYDVKLEAVTAELRTIEAQAWNDLARSTADMPLPEPSTLRVEPCEGAVGGILAPDGALTDEWTFERFLSEMSPETAEAIKENLYTFKVGGQLAGAFPPVVRGRGGKRFGSSAWRLLPLSACWSSYFGTVDLTRPVSARMKIHLTIGDNALGEMAVEIPPTVVDFTTVFEENHPFAPHLAAAIGAFLSSEPAHSTYVSAIIEEMKKEPNMRAKMLDMVADEYRQGGDLKSIALELEGAREAVEMYVALGLPDVYDGNDTVRLLLDGTSAVRVADDRMLAELAACARGEPACPRPVQIGSSVQAVDVLSLALRQKSLVPLFVEKSILLRQHLLAAIDASAMDQQYGRIEDTLTLLAVFTEAGPGPLVLAAARRLHSRI